MMAYDRYDTRRDRDWRGNSDYERGRRDERGFFERAGDEIASWFGDDDAERRRRQDEQMNRGSGREGGWGRESGWGRDRDRDYDRGLGRDYDRDRQSFASSDRDFDRGNRWSSRSTGWGSGDRDQRSGQSMRGYAGYDRDFTSRGGIGGSMSSDYMSPTGPSFGYGGTYGAGSSSGYGSGGYGSGFGGDRESDRSYRPMAGDYGRSDRNEDRHYHSWRQRQLDELDRDYDHYCRERQNRFESDFGTWRQNRMSKRQHLGSIREQMDVVGSDGETVGKVDCVKGDHIVLTKSDSDDNRHHMIDCSMVQTVDGDQVRLEMPAEEAKSRFQESDGRGLFGRDDDRSERGERTDLERSFSGTYER